MNEIFLHPELEEGEVFLSNINQRAFNEINWKSKRKGNVALDGKGLMTSNNDWFPVFVSIEELNKSNKNINDIRREIRNIVEVKYGKI